MSVINRMLQDLDARGAAQPSPAVAPSTEAAAPARKVIDIPDTPFQVNAAARRRGGRRAAAKWRMWATAWAALAAACVYSASPQIMDSFGAGARSIKQQAVALWQAVPEVKLPTRVAAPAVAAPVASPVVVAAVAPRQGLAMDWTLSALVTESRPVHAAAKHAAMRSAQQPAEVVAVKQAVASINAPITAQTTAQAADLADKTAAVAAPAPAPVANATPSNAVSKYAGSERRFTMIDPPAAGATTSAVGRAASAYHRALDLADEGRDTAALEAAQDALRIDPQHAAARRLAASLALNLNRVDQAGAFIDEGLKADPNDAELQYLRARALVVSGMNEQALAALQSQARPTADALGLKAGLLAHEGQYPQAARAYEQALREQPSNATWWLGLGVACDAQGQAVPARNAFNRARALGTLRNDLQAWVEQKLASSN